MDTDSDSSEDLFEDALDSLYDTKKEEYRDASWRLPQLDVGRVSSAADGSDYSVDEQLPASSHVYPLEESSTGHTSQSVSGKEAIRLLHALLHREETVTSATAISQRPSVQDMVREVHVHLVQTNVHNPSAVSIGGSIVNPHEVKSAETRSVRTVSRLQKLRSETEKTIELWTGGMVKTRATDVILKSILKGRTWITITGSPGEGKTTAGYLVLKQLHNMGRQVYDIKTPDDYYVTKDSRQPVLMFNDILGSSHFCHDKRWEEVLSDILVIVEHKRDGDTDYFKDKQQQPVVILVTRSNVLKDAAPFLGKFKDFLVGERRVVDLTNGTKTNPAEKLQIWKYHSRRYNVVIDEKTVKEVCQMPLLHGFPHCCKLFASMYSKNKLLDMKYFFSKPLEFLNQTMEFLILEHVTGPLLREMLKKNGRLDLNSITDYERRFKYTSVVDTLSTTYLTHNGTVVTFQHPSVYDSAAFVMCKKDPLFVIENCSLLFLNERVRFVGIQYGQHQEGQNTVLLSQHYVSTFLERLLAEFEREQLSAILTQQVFHDEYFTAQFIHSVLPTSMSDERQLHTHSMRQLIHRVDKTSKESFLFLSTRSSSDKILKFICGMLALNGDDVTEALFGIIEHTSLTCLEFLHTHYSLNFNAVNTKFQTPLLLAATKGSQQMLEHILQDVFDIGEGDKKNNNPLHLICRHGLDGDGTVVKMLIERGADISHESNQYPWLPLHIACHYGHKNIVKCLLECGADIHQFSRGGITALHNASWMGHADIVTFLLENGADPNISSTKMNEGKTALHDACFKGHLDVVTTLIDKGADANKLSTVGENTNLHYACLMGHLDVVLFLINSGAEVNSSSSSGVTPLHCACCLGSNEVVEVLLDRGADIRKPSSLGDTALHTASWMGHVDVVTLLLGKGAEINASNGCVYKNKTPLHDACFQGHLDVVSVLIENGADVHKRDSEGNTPSMLAEGRKHSDVVAFLFEREKL